MATTVTRRTENPLSYNIKNDTTAKAFFKRAPIVEITIDKNPVNLSDYTTQARAVLKDSTGTALGTGLVTKWESSNTNIAVINNISGQITAVAAGTTTITATITYNGKDYKGTSVLNVGATSQQYTVEVVITPTTSVTLGSGGTKATARFKNSSGTLITTNISVAWQSGTTAVATINNAGDITTVAAGTSIITATVTYDNKTYSGTSTLTVTGGTTGGNTGGTVTFNPSLSNLVFNWTRGATQYPQPLTVTVKNEDQASHTVKFTIAQVQNADSGITITDATTGAAATTFVLAAGATKTIKITVPNTLYGKLADGQTVINLSTDIT